MVNKEEIVDLVENTDYEQVHEVLKIVEETVAELDDEAILECLHEII